MKMKKLLAILTSVTLLFGVVSVSLVPSASETVGTITVEDVEIEPTATSFDVDVKIDFTDIENGVIAPHNIVSITCANDSFELTNVELGTVEYKYTGSTTDENGATVNLPNGVVTVATDGVKDVNWDEGKILIQAPVDDSAPIVTEINLTATFTLKTDATLTEGTYAITVNGDDMTNVDMDTIDVTAGEGTLTVATPVTECEHVNAANRVVTFENNAINYNTVCTVCGEVVATEADASADAATVAGTVAGFKEYAAIELTETGTVAIPFTTDSTSIKVAYVDGAKVMAANGLNSKTTPYDVLSVNYADGVANVTSQVTGVVIVYTLTDSTALDAVLTSNGMNYGFELLSSIDAKFKLNKAADNANFDSYETVLYHEVPGETDLRVTSVTQYETIGNYHCFSYPLRACELGDYVDGYFYGIKDGVHYPIRVLENANVVTYATSSACFGSTSTATDVLNLKALIADMIVYGSCAQEYFAYGLDRLIADDPAISSYVQQYATGKTYTADELASMKVAKAEYSDAAYYDKANNKRYLGFIPSLNIQSKIELNLKVNFANFYSYNFNNSAETEFDKISFQIQYVDYTNGETVTEDVEKSKFTEDGNVLLYVSDYYPAAKMDQPLVLIVNYDGTYFAKVTYNIHAYLADKYNDTSKKGGTKTLGDFCKAAMAYGTSAKTYFN